MSTVSDTCVVENLTYICELVLEGDCNQIAWKKLYIYIFSYKSNEWSMVQNCKEYTFSLLKVKITLHSILEK